VNLDDKPAWVAELVRFLLTDDGELPEDRCVLRVEVRDGEVYCVDVTKRYEQRQYQDRFSSEFA